MAFVNSIRSVVKFRKLEINRTKRLLRKAANVEDLRKLAKRRLPVGVFDYIDGGMSNLNNHPLIYWTIKSAMESKYINKHFNTFFYLDVG